MIQLLHKSKISLWLCVAILLGSNIKMHAQSSSSGSAYVYGGGITSMVGQHNFLTGSGTISLGIIGSERSTSSSYGFLQGSSWLNASDNAFIDGYATTYNIGAFTFPIGDNGKYRPTAVTAASNAAPTSAAYYGVNPTTATTSSLAGGTEAALPTGAPFAITSKAATVSAITDKEYWDIKGTTVAKISLTWDANSAIGTLTSSTLANLTIVGWNGTQWVKIPSTVDATSILGGASSLTVGSITTDAAFTPNTYTIYSFGVSLVCVVPTVGGIVAYSGGALCNTSNIGTAMLTGNTGNIVRWETSTNAGSTWSPIASTTSSYNFINAANAQQYRAVVNNGAGCLDANALPVTIATNAAACSSLTCDNLTGNVTINVVTPPSLSAYGSKIIFTNASGVIQYTSATNLTTVNGIAIGDYLVYRVVYDSTQLPLPVLSVGTNISAVGGACVKFTNQLAYKVCTGGSVLVSAKVLLSGNYNTLTGLMNDELRVKNLIPTAQPYSGLTDFAYSGTETTTPSVLSVSGTNAIVDWVLVELRDATTPTTIVARKAALLQRDGNIVSTDGVSPVTLTATSGNYYVVVRHRNHLGVMTATTRSLSGTTTSVDFTSILTTNYQRSGLTGNVHAQKTVGLKRALWAGNTNTNAFVSFTSGGNDTDPVYFKVLGDVGNAAFAANYIVNNTYAREDINLDGKVIYQSTDNELDTILFGVLGHLLNLNSLNSYVIYQQLP